MCSPGRPGEVLSSDSLTGRPAWAPGPCGYAEARWILLGCLCALGQELGNG